MTVATDTLPAAEAARLRRWRLRVFAATWLCYAGYYFCRRPWYVAKSTVGKDLGFDAATLGTIGALYLVAYAASQFAAGALGNRFGPRVMLLSGMAVSIAANVGFGMASSSEAFLVLMTVNGIAQATGWSSTVGTMASWFNRQERGAVMGAWTTNFQAGGVMANALSGFVLAHYGWQQAFFAGAAALASVWLVVLTNQRNRPSDEGLPPVLDKEEVEGKVVDEPATGLGWTRDVVFNVVLVGLYYFCVKLIRYAMWSWAPFFLNRNFGLPADEASYYATLGDLCGIPGVMLTGWLSDRFFGSRRAGVTLLMTSLLLLVSIGMATVGGTSKTLFVVGLALAGFTLYGPDALMSGAGAMDIGNRRGATLAAGLISGIGSVGPVVQELVIGRMYDSSKGDLGPILFFLVGSALAAVATMVVAVTRNRLGHKPI